MDDYAQDIKKSVEVYYQLFDPDTSEFSDNEKIWLQRLARAKKHDVRLLCLVVIQTVKEDDRRIQLFKTLEKFAFLLQIKSYSFREISLEQFSIKLKAADLTAEEISRQLEAICKKFVDSAEFNDSIRSIGKSDGYYGWSGLRYFLFEFEQNLRTKSKTTRQLLTWETFQSEDFDSDYKSIEHIYPQTARDPYWKESFTKFSIAERNVLRNSLGNLLPISAPKNASLSNKSFELKRGSIQNQVGYFYGCLSEIQVAQQDNWHATHIVARGLMLLSFMEERWDFTLGNDDKKIEHLGLGFVLSREGIPLSKLKEQYEVAIPQAPQGKATREQR